MVLLASCAAAGVVATSDPERKLRDANDLLYVAHRPLPAERLIIEARDETLASGNRVGLADSYRTYALFLRSAPVKELAEHYRVKGFLDGSTTFDTRYSGSLGYLSRAERIYIEAKRDDMLSNLYFHMGMVSKLNGDLPGACAYLERSVTANAAYVLEHPNGPDELPAGCSTYMDAINASRKGIGCQ
jgi:hypothetical protein